MNIDEYAFLMMAPLNLVEDMHNNVEGIDKLVKEFTDELDKLAFSSPVEKDIFNFLFKYMQTYGRSYDILSNLSYSDQIKVLAEVRNERESLRGYIY